MLKKLLPLFIIGLFALNFTACDSSSDSAAAVVSADPPAVVQEMSGLAYSAVSAAMTQAISPSKVVSTTSGTINYSVPGCTVTGTWTNLNSVFTYNLHFVWSGYLSRGVTLQSGTVDLVYVMNSLTSTFTYDYTGDFSVIYQLVTYAMGWDISMVYASGAYTYDGTYTVNNATYSWSLSGK